MTLIHNRAVCLALAIASGCAAAWAGQATRPNAGAGGLGARVKQLYKQGKYAEALPLAAQALKLAELARPQDPAALNIALANLAEVDDVLGHYAEAEPLYLRALSIDEKQLGPYDPDVASDLDSLGRLYEREHRYADARPLFDRALAIDEKAKDVDPGDLAALLSDAAALSEDEGDYARAEELYRRALELDHKANGDQSAEVATDLENFANLDDAEGKFADAEKLYKLAIAIDEQALGADDPGLATDLSDYADHARRVGDNDQAEALCLRALHIREKALGPDNAAVAVTLNILALLYQQERRYAEAEPLFTRSMAIRSRVFGENNPGYATALNNLAELDKELGRLDAAEPLLKRSLAILERTTLPGNPDLESAILNLAILYAAQGKPAAAEPLFERGFSSLFDRFQASFTFMTEKERLGFLDTVSYDFRRYFSFVHSFHAQNPALIGSMYNLLLWQKGFIAGSVADMRRQAEASGDRDTLKLLGELSAKRAQIAALLAEQPGQSASAAQPDVRAQQLDTLRRDTDLTEKALVGRSARYAEHKALDRTTWQQVRDALHPGEAAVEFCRFRFYGDAKAPAFYYVALVVTRESHDQPQYILLGDDQQIESDAIAHFKHALATRGFQQPAESALPGPHAYDLVWKPLEPALAGITRVYLAADGVLNQVPLGIIPAPGGKLLMEKYDLRLVTSTRDLLRAPVVQGSRTALLLGDPAFDLTDERQRAALAKLGKPNPSSGAPQPASALAGGLPQQASAQLPPLPATGDEVRAIAGLMQQQGWQASVYTGDQALKSAVEQAGSPRVLHLATHGFFLPDPAGSSELTGDFRALLQPGQYSVLNDPMLRSGLYFAAADRTLAGTPSPPGLDNGVLTALEAGNLNLSGTELVVLSACNTGQGEEKNGEGVFGLRRALQEAGAQSVLMSLWSVPDKETLQLMQRFYAKWLAGMEMHQALRDAQIEMREQVRQTHDGKDLPYYWGAFVLIGR